MLTIDQDAGQVVSVDLLWPSIAVLVTSQDCYMFVGMGSLQGGPELIINGLKWVTGVITLFIGAITRFASGVLGV